jgi:lipoprotein-releasing system ATP-binding protein
MANDTPDAQLKVENVTKEYTTGEESLKVLDRVSFDLSPGRVLVIVGPSGSGKSTLLNIIGTLDKPTEGNVFLGDTDVTELDDEELARFRNASVGFVFQDHHLLPQCTALENVIVPTLAGGGGGADRARELLERVGLGERLHQMPSRLSGGERQRVAIARAMVNDAPLILADEPTGNLDRDTGQNIADLFVELAEKDKRMLVVVTHDLELADRFEWRMELRDGTLEEQ